MNRDSKRLPFFDFGRMHERLLITGGTGFIGHMLCEALLRHGHELTLLVRNPLKASQQFQNRVHCVTKLDELAPGTEIDVVVNLAGERVLGPRWSAERRRTLVSSRVGTTQSLVTWIAAAKHKPRLMISGSAIGFYGVQATNDSRVLDENAGPQSDFLSQLCRQWEETARAVTFEGVPLALLRLGLVLGHEGALPRMRLPFMLGLGGRIGSGRQVMSWVHIEDVVGVIAFLIAHAEPRQISGTYNVTAPHAVTQSEFARTLAAELHRPAFTRLPAALLRLVLGAQAVVLLEGQRVYPMRLEQLGYKFRFARLDSALRDLLHAGAN